MGDVNMDYHDLAKPLFTVAASKTVARSVILEFLKAGHSAHSGRGNTLGAVMRYCEKNKIPYTLEADPGKGYVIRRKE